jgi:hypothetical protein
LTAFNVVPDCVTASVKRSSSDAAGEGEENGHQDSTSSNPASAAAAKRS